MFDPDAMGAALFELALVPDFELFQQAERAPARVARNRECVERVTWSTKTERVRALELGLLDPVFCKQLGEFFSRIGVFNVSLLFDPSAAERDSNSTPRKPSVLDGNLLNLLKDLRQASCLDEGSNGSYHNFGFVLMKILRREVMEFSEK